MDVKTEKTCSIVQKSAGELRALFRHIRRRKTPLVRNRLDKNELSAKSITSYPHEWAERQNNALVEIGLSGKKGERDTWI